MKKLSKLDISIFILYLIAVISLFLPYSTQKSEEIINELNMREVFIETSDYWYENFVIFFVLSLTILIAITSFSERNWMNKIRNIIFSLFTIGILVFIAVGIKLGNHGPIPQLTIYYYLMNFAILAIIILANMKMWKKENLD